MAADAAIESAFQQYVLVGGGGVLKGAREGREGGG